MGPNLPLFEPQGDGAVDAYGKGFAEMIEDEENPVSDDGW